MQDMKEGYLVLYIQIHQFVQLTQFFHTVFNKYITNEFTFLRLFSQFSKQKINNLTYGQYQLKVQQKYVSESCSE